MHLNDAALAHLIPVACHHEQACAIAAEGYSRAGGPLPVVNVTTGPGGLNTLTGLMGQWTDSAPCIYISGQVKFETTLESVPHLGLRQLGDQEVDIISVVKPLTKYAVTLKDPADTIKVLDEAVWHATQGRPGPVWINVPMNVQGAMIDPGLLREFSPPPMAMPALRDHTLRSLFEHLMSAKRPLLVAGRGIRLAGAQRELLQILERLGIPCTTTLNGYDLVPSDHPSWVGRIGNQGTRAGNFAIQSADFVLFVGTRNNIRQVTYNWTDTAQRAFCAVVDNDRAELEKPLKKPDLPVHADAGEVLRGILALLNESAVQKSADSRKKWLTWCIERRDRYPVVTDKHRSHQGTVDPYVFADELTDQLPEGAILVTANGTANVTLFQAGKTKADQICIWNSGCASMGYELPAAIGAALARPGIPVTCVAGDGSLMMNLQELATISHLKLPIRILLLDNGGYASIRQTQERFFQRLVGCGPESGLGFPSWDKIASAFNLTFSRISKPEELKKGIMDALKHAGPSFVEILTRVDTSFEPKVSSMKLPDGKIVSKPLHDMFPFLPDEEVKSNLWNE
jgi:acetolactate synthase-1/2/3 large subunit